MPNKKLPVRIYVCGAYSADNVMDVLKNIGKGNEYCSVLFSLGYAPYSPWSDFLYFFTQWDNPDITKQMFYDYSLSWLEVCQGVFCVPGFEDSKGSQIELARARQLDLPIFENLRDLELYFNGEK